MIHVPKVVSQYCHNLQLRWYRVGGMAGIAKMLNTEILHVTVLAPKYEWLNNAHK
jgi:hypothetical protein